MGRKYSLISGIVLVLSAALSGVVFVPVLAQTITPEVIITRPRDGEALQGVIVIEGRIRGQGLRAADASFAFKSDAPLNWFPISDLDFERDSSSQQEFRIEWDTTRITDGNYHVRIRAEYEGGETAEIWVKNLRVRNYSAVETVTPHPAGTVTPTGEEPPEGTKSPSDVKPTPTPLPPNPVSIQQGEIAFALARGLAGVVGFFLIYGIYRLIRKWAR